MKTQTIAFPDDQYVKEVTTKKQICIHHTASGEGIEGDVNWWKKTPERVATPFLIDRKGVIYQLFDEKYWAHHLGLKVANNTILNKQCIGIELDSWGWLTDGKSYTGTKVTAPTTSYAPAGWRGKNDFESYTPEQLKALGYLLAYLCKKHNISNEFKGLGIFEVDNRALSGQNGIFTHASYRADKTDCHPQPQFIDVLKNINDYCEDEC